MLKIFIIEAALFGLACFFVLCSLLRLIPLWKKLGAMQTPTLALIKAAFFLIIRAPDPSGMFFMGWQVSSLFTNQATLALLVESNLFIRASSHISLLLT